MNICVLFQVTYISQQHNIIVEIVFFGTFIYFLIWPHLKKNSGGAPAIETIVRHCSTSPLCVLWTSPEAGCDLGFKHPRVGNRLQVQWGGWNLPCWSSSENHKHTQSTYSLTPPPTGAPVGGGTLGCWGPYTTDKNIFPLKKKGKKRNT